MKDELKPWVDNDQIKRIGMLLNQHTRKKVENAVEREIEEAIEFAEKSDFPSFTELYADMFED